MSSSIPGEKHFSPTFSCDSKKKKKNPFVSCHAEQNMRVSENCHKLCKETCDCCCCCCCCDFGIFLHNTISFFTLSWPHHVKISFHKTFTPAVFLFWRSEATTQTNVRIKTGATNFALSRSADNRRAN